MEIDHIDVINLRHRYPHDSGFRGAGGQCNARVTSLVLVYTDGPHVGIGSAYSHPAWAGAPDRQAAPVIPLWGSARLIVTGEDAGSSTTVSNCQASRTYRVMSNQPSAQSMVW